MSCDGWIDKENEVYTCNGITFRLRKEGNPVISRTGINLEDMMQSEISQISTIFF